MNGEKVVDGPGPAGGHDKAIVVHGHAEYKNWMGRVGMCFSPLTCSKVRHVMGSWESWTVEGLYQGLKRIRIFDLSLLDGQLEARLVESDDTGHIIHLPAIMEVKEDLIQHPLFQALKSGKRYHAKRNRYFGVLPTGQRNWKFTDTWLHASSGAAITRGEFSKLVKGPAMRAHLSQFPEEVAQLRRAWANGENLISDAMRQAHGHLRLVEEFVGTLHE